MSGICSAHQHHEPGCPACEAMPPGHTEAALATLRAHIGGTGLYAPHNEPFKCLDLIEAEREALLAVAQAAQAATFALWENSDEERAAADALRAALGRLNQDTT